MVVAGVHTQHPTSCIAGKWERTRPRRCTVGRAGMTDTSWPSEKHNRHHNSSTSASRPRPCPTNSEVAYLTSVSYSSVLLSDSSNFPYCFHVKEKKKSQLNSTKWCTWFGENGVAVLSNTPGMLACLLSRKSESWRPSSLSIPSQT